MRALLSVYDKTGVVDLAQGLAELGWELVSSGGTAKVAGRGRHPGHRRGRPHRFAADARAPGGDAAPQGARRHPGRPRQPRARGRHGRLRHRGHRAGGVQPLPVLVGPLDRADRHRRTGHGAGRGQEPRLRRGHRRTRPTTQPVLAEMQASGLAERRHPPAPGPRRLRRHRRLRRGHRGLARLGGRHRARAGRIAGARRERPAAHHPAHAAARAEAALRREPASARGPLRRRWATTAGGSRWRCTTARSSPTSTCTTPTPPGGWSTAWATGPAAVIIKHANPCGVAIDDDITTAYRRAHECDPTSAPSAGSWP